MKSQNILYCRHAVLLLCIVLTTLFNQNLLAQTGAPPIILEDSVPPNISLFYTGDIYPEGYIIITEGSLPPLLQVVGTSGGSGSYTYQWYKKSRSEGQDSLIIGATSAAYQPPASTEEMLYRCRVQSSDLSAFTSWKTIYFQDPNYFGNYTSSMNYVVSCAPTEGVKSLGTLGQEKRQQSSKIVYFDGLGYPVQTILPKQTPEGNDLISMLSYDAYGREHKQYLPYPKYHDGAFVNVSTVLSDLETFYGDDGLRAFSETVYERSSLNRVLEQIAPGAAWENHPARFDYQSNTSPIGSWEALADGSFSTLTYQPNQLYIVQVADENENLKREYKDKLGNLIMTEQFDGNEWLQTRYVYNHLNMLAAVVPPKANNVNDQSLCFYYRYDYRGRVVEKKIPGAEWIFMAYDRFDRLIYTQDGNQRAKGQWIRYSYDNFNRERFRELFIPAVIEGNTSGLPILPIDTTQQIQPIDFRDRFDTLLVTYYDTYPAGYLDFVANNLADTFTTKNKNRVTMQKMLVLGEDIYLTTIYYYDKYGRVIQAATQNHLGGVDRVSTSYDFRGNILQTLQLSSWVNSDEETDSISLRQRFEYDALKRPTAVLLSINEGEEITISETEYDELIRLKTKTLHNGSETISYDYNIRNWLKTIESELFTQELFYEQTPEGSHLAAPQYNGNISATSWKTPRQSDFQSYAFSYDGVDRLTSSEFYDGSDWGADYTEHLTYDKNGNITRHTRLGYVVVDLYVSHSYNGNQLSHTGAVGLPTVIENPGKAGGVPMTINMYFYDANGNLVQDPQTIIDYNLLNLPQQITLSGDRTITNVYTAGGQKIQTLVREGNETLPAGTKYYNGNLVFNMNKELDYILFSEGRIVCDENNDFSFEYHLKDHLGSVRVAFVPEENEKTVTQINAYYPFGAPIADLSFSNSDNKYLREGKEYIDDFDWNKYDFHARTFDSFGGRSLQIDPMAESYYDISPYALWGNNPVSRIDPDGRKWKTKEDEEKAKEDQEKLKEIAKEQGKKADVAQKEIDKINKNKELNEEQRANLKKKEDELEKAKILKNMVEDIITGIDELKKSEITYTFNNLGENATTGELSPPNKEGVVVINYVGGDFLQANRIHELVHATQYNQKPFATKVVGGVTIFALTKADHANLETPAYMCQYLVSRQSLQNYHKLKSVWDVATWWLNGMK